MMSAWEQLIADGRVRSNVRLGSLTTYKMGGPALYWAEPADLEDLASIGRVWRDHPIPVLVLGRGSNVVVAESGFGGLVIRLRGSFAQFVVGAATEAGGAMSLPLLARAAVKAGRLGLEFMVGIPGTVGGAVRQNAGCFGSEVVDVLEWAEIFDLEGGVLERMEPADLDLGYRSSNVRRGQIVVKARLRTSPGDPTEGEGRLRQITRWRRLHQPGGTLNAGSVFKNPAGDTAGRIIDSLDLKGFRVGGAAVSERHANFFVADPGASPEDVYRLVERVRARVREATGITLETEIQFVGDFEAAGED